MQAMLPFALVTLTVAAAAYSDTSGQGTTPPSSAIKFDNVRLLVSRFDESYAFYRDLLGLKPTWGKPGDNYASFAFPGGAQIALFRKSLMADALGTSTQPSTRREQDTAALILSVDDVDVFYARLKAAGVEFTGAPQNQPVWGIRAAHFRDPDGNLLEAFSPLKK